MAEIYDFLIHRTARLVDEMSRQSKMDHCEVLDCKTCLTDAVSQFEDSIESLKNIGEGLEKHQRQCEQVYTLADECVAAIEDSALEKLIEYREKYLKKNRGKKNLSPVIIS